MANAYRENPEKNHGLPVVADELIISLKLIGLLPIKKPQASINIEPVNHDSAVTLKPFGILVLVGWDRFSKGANGFSDKFIQ